MAAGERVRQPYAALIGFYPADPDSLIKTIESSFLDSRWGPGRLPRGPVEDTAPLGGVAPHAGYSYSGPAAAHLFLALAESRFRPDTVVIVGTNHTGYGGIYTTATSWEAWATPLGEVPVDLEMIEQLLRETGRVVDEPLAHVQEHSVEVELPFLQYIYRGHDWSLVPITARDATPSMARELAEAVARAAERLGRRILFLASSDFTHHGPMYGYVVFTENIAENVRRLDLSIIEPILRLDLDGFYKRIIETGATVCGYSAIAALIEYTRLHEGKMRLLQYYNSAELTGEEEIAVGYAAILAEKQ